MLQKSPVPVTNIDDLDITVSDNNVTTININETPADTDGEKVEATPDQPEAPKLIGTISLTGGATGSSPKPVVRSTLQPHMNGGDRNSTETSVKVGILRHSTNGVDDSNKPSATDAESNPKFQQNAAPSTDNNPVMQYYDPPLRRYTAYNHHGGAEHKEKKGCCVIL